MPIETSIVIYGKDPILVETRQRILDRAGFTSKAMEEISEVVAALKRKDSALLILCSSLSEEERELALFAVDKLQKPGLKTLILSKKGEMISHPNPAQVLQTPLAPETFVSLVRDEVS
jgi:hypothetical protein